MSLTAPHPARRHPASSAPAAANPWPTVSDMLCVKRSSVYNVGRRLKTSAVLLQARLHRPALSRAFDDMPWAGTWFARHPMLFRAVLDQYLDVRHGMARRFHLVTQDLRHIQARRAEGRLQALIDHDHITLWQDPAVGLQVQLALNLHTPQEGLWRLQLLRTDDARFVYALSFSVVQQRLVVGAMQGVKGDDGQALVRDATKALHGVRPHFFLVEVLRQLAASWRSAGLQGIDPAHQLKANEGSADCHMVKFDYAAFWQELGGSRQADDLWSLPLHTPRKDLAEVESKKRSMYRKRYAMLDALALDVAARA